MLQLVRHQKALGCTLTANDIKDTKIWMTQNFPKLHLYAHGRVGLSTSQLHSNYMPEWELGSAQGIDHHDMACRALARLVFYDG